MRVSTTWRVKRRCKRRRPNSPSIGRNGAVTRLITTHPSGIIFRPNGTSENSTAAPVSGTRLLPRISSGSHGSGRKPTVMLWSLTEKSTSAPTIAAVGSSVIPRRSISVVSSASIWRRANFFGSTVVRNCRPAECMTGRCRESVARRLSKAIGFGS